MKGIVFIVLSELVETQHGIEAWEEILQEVKPECEGVYISTASYPDDEMIKYVKAISKKLSLPSTEITKVFGRYLFNELNDKYGFFTKQCANLFEFLDSIENVIHKEVRKLYQDVNLPTIDCTVDSPNEMLMLYHSPRKLCYLAEGLISGAADHFEEPIALTHEKCMHDGESRCELRIIKQL